MANKRLFDDVQTTADPWQYTESNFGAFSRAAGQQWDRVRQCVEDWYADYPDPDGDLRARFRQDEPRQHDAAWWELYNYTLFRKLGYDVEVHPTIPGSSRRPDLLATRSDSQLYVECAVGFDSEINAQVDGEAWLKDCINAIDSPDFGFSMRVDSFGTQRAQKADVKNQIERWLSTLDYDREQSAMASDGRPRESRSFAFRDWRITLTAMPYPPHLRSTDGPNIVMGPAKSLFGETSVDSLRTILRKKARQCRHSEAPVIIAVLSRKVFARSQEVAQSLFGSESMIYHLDDEATTANFARCVRKKNGIWHPGPPPRGAGVSAVLFAEQMQATHVGLRLPELWVNPWAKFTVPTDLPFEKHSADESGKLVDVVDATREAHVVFGLPPDWPKSP